MKSLIDFSKKFSPKIKKIKPVHNFQYDYISDLLGAGIDYSLKRLFCHYPHGG